VKVALPAAALAGEMAWRARPAATAATAKDTRRERERLMVVDY
jgi:hypothetical protein